MASCTFFVFVLIAVHIPSRDEENSRKLHVTEANHNVNENHTSKKNGYTKGKNGFNHNLDYNKTITANTADDNDNKNVTEKLMEKKGKRNDNVNTI